MYKPFQIRDPQTQTAKNPSVKSPPKYSPPPGGGGGLVLWNCPQIHSKTKQKR